MDIYNLYIFYIFYNLNTYWRPGDECHRRNTDEPLFRCLHVGFGVLGSNRAGDGVTTGHASSHDQLRFSTRTIFAKEGVMASRRINLSGFMRLQDYETFGDNEKKKVFFSQSLIVNSEDPDAEWHFERGVGGEVRGELDLVARLTTNNRVRITMNIALYEGTTESTQDLDGERTYTFSVNPGGSVTVDRTVYNEEEDDEDFVRVYLTASNLNA